MIEYAIFFDYANTTYRLPVNPEELITSSKMATQTYEVLNLGQIEIPTHMELTEYSFECEIPSTPYGYVETANDFKDCSFYERLFKSWRDGLVPVRFIARNGIGDDINTLVLITSVEVTEKAGEEGDKYFSFTLKEYKKHGLKEVVVIQSDEIPRNYMRPVIASTKSATAKGTYTGKAGDTLWAIAKRTYGSGTQFTKIYNANKDKIKNPNLIRVGQVIILP